MHCVPSLRPLAGHAVRRGLSRPLRGGAGRFPADFQRGLAQRVPPTEPHLLFRAQRRVHPACPGPRPPHIPFSIRRSFPQRNRPAPLPRQRHDPARHHCLSLLGPVHAAQHIPLGSNIPVPPVLQLLGVRRIRRQLHAGAGHALQGLDPPGLHGHQPVRPRQHAPRAARRAGHPLPLRPVQAETNWYLHSLLRVPAGRDPPRAVLPAGRHQVTLQTTFKLQN